MLDGTEQDQAENAVIELRDYFDNSSIGELFKALSDENRISILTMLATCDEACCVQTISEQFPVDNSVISRHLATLKRASIVKSVRRGKRVYYEAQVDSLIQSLRGLADALEDACPPNCDCDLREQPKAALVTSN